MTIIPGEICNFLQISEGKYVDKYNFSGRYYYSNSYYSAIDYNKVHLNSKKEF
jgi:hypothetical protein